MIRLVALVAALLTVCITASSAFIRHAQNGVGCVDWPACYRTAHATAAAPGIAASPAPGTTSHPPAAVTAKTDDLPGVRSARALHRVSATTVGVLVLVVTVLGWTSLAVSGRVAAVVAVTVTAFLAWLGRYTPHDLPLVTLGNLVGGLLLTAVLGWVAAALHRRGGAGSPAVDASAPAGAAITRSALVALALVALLAYSGTMIGARHAIDACATPLCMSGARPSVAAFDPWQASPALDAGARQGLQVAHRIVALAFALAVGLLAWRLRATRRRLAVWLVVLVAAQVVIGAATSIGIRPLVAATLHNVVATLLVMTLGIVAGGARASRAPTPTRPPRGSTAARSEPPR